jgi:hypothetical protein
MTINENWRPVWEGDTGISIKEYQGDPEFSFIIIKKFEGIFDRSS